MMISDEEIEELGQAFDELGVAMRRARARSAAYASDGLTPAQYELLRALRDHSPDGGLQISSLAKVAGLAKPTVTRMLAVPDLQGLVKREASSRDGRATYVTLTSAGVDAVRAFQNNRRAKQRRTYSSWSPDERRVLLDALRRLIALADEHADYSSPGSEQEGLARGG